MIWPVLILNLILTFNLLNKYQCPQRVADFFRVSTFQYFNDTEGVLSPEEMDNSWCDIKIPKRATKGSAGYDFYAPYAFELNPGETIKIPTGIRAKIKEGWWLGILPRSSLGFKYRAQLDNTMGVVDSDYYYSDNQGHIFIKLTNCTKDKTMSIAAGEAFAQGIFLPFGATYDDDATAIRNGGFGSTNK